MSGTQIAAVWQIGPQITAQVLGLPFDLFRPRTTGPVATLTNFVQSIPAWITADPNLMSARAFDYGKPRGFAAVNPGVVQVGDYLQGALTVGGPTETFFVASMDIPAPIQVVRCNHALTFYRPSAGTPGASYYGGDLTTNQTTLVTSWPAAIIQGTKGNDGDTKLPSDQRLPWVQILMPNVLGVQFRFADFAYDDQPQPCRYELSSTELTPLGWRLTASLVVS